MSIDDVGIATLETLSIPTGPVRDNDLLQGYDESCAQIAPEPWRIMQVTRPGYCVDEVI